MDYREIGKTGIRVSALGLGTMNFDTDWHGIGRVDEKTARDILDLAVDHGVNFIDTADIYGYGAAEMCLGRMLKGRRDRFVIATKVLGRMLPGDPASGAPYAPQNGATPNGPMAKNSTSCQMIR